MARQAAKCSHASGPLLVISHWRYWLQRRMMHIASKPDSSIWTHHSALNNIEILVKAENVSVHRVLTIIICFMNFKSSEYLKALSEISWWCKTRLRMPDVSDHNNFQITLGLIKENVQTLLLHIILSFANQHKENYLEMAVFNVQCVLNPINASPCPLHNEMSFIFNIRNSLFVQKIF